MIHRFTQLLLPSAAGVLCAIFVFAGTQTSAQAATSATQPQALPTPTGHVNDFAGVIDEATRKSLEAKLRALKQRRDVEFAVVTIDTTGDVDIFDYSLRLARAWGVGAKESDHAGLLLVVAVKDRKSFMQVSRHLEGDLPDGVTGATLRLMRESFRQANYGAGINVCVDSLIARLDGSERTAAPTAPQTFMDRVLVWALIAGALLVGVVVLSLFAYLFFRVFIKPWFSPTPQRASSVTDNDGGVNSTDDSFASSTSSSSWSSSESSSSSSSADSSSSFDSFGGGSDYGGGGAGDSW